MPAVPSPNVKLTIELKPAEAAALAKVKIDGKDVEGLVTEFKLADATKKQSVKIAIKADGYKELEKTIDVQPEADTIVSFEMTKKPSAVVSVKQPPRPDSLGGTGATTKPVKPGKKPGGGLIDI